MITHAPNPIPYISGLTPLARIVSMADSAGPPIKFPIAPVRAMELAMEYAGITVADLARVEV